MGCLDVHTEFFLVSACHNAGSYQLGKGGRGLRGRGLSHLLDSIQAKHPQL